MKVHGFISMLMAAAILSPSVFSCEKAGSDTPGADPVTPQKTTDTVFRVAIYNVLVNDGRRTEMKFEKCADSLGQAIRNCRADVLCLNEIDQTFASRLPSIVGSTSYIWDLSNPNKITEDGQEYYYSNGIAYNSDKFRLVSKGMYWFTSGGSYTSDKSEAKSYHVPKYCTMVWCKLRHISTSKVIWFVSTHFPLAADGVSSGYQTGEAHMLCAKAMNSFALSISEPCIFGADLNSSALASDAAAAGYSLLCQKWTDVYDALQKNGGLDPFYDTWCGTMSGSSAKYHYDVMTFTCNHPGRRIDHIMYRSGQKCAVEPRTYGTVMTEYNVNGESFCPSDHLPVVSEFVIHQ